MGTNITVSLNSFGVVDLDESEGKDGRRSDCLAERGGLSEGLIPCASRHLLISWVVETLLPMSRRVSIRSIL